jgi:hypothetical protein
VALTSSFTEYESAERDFAAIRVGGYAMTGIGGGVTIGMVTCRQQAVDSQVRPVLWPGLSLRLVAWLLRAQDRAMGLIASNILCCALDPIPSSTEWPRERRNGG